MKTVTTALAISALFVAAAAYAGPIQPRQVRQGQRIDQGVRSGSLTPSETRVLRVEQTRIARTRDRALADGVMGPHEASRLTHEQNLAGRDIYRLKHNALAL